MSGARRRGDGTVLSDVDLAQAAPMMADELDDIARLLDLVEEWLRLDEVARDLLADWLADATAGWPATAGTLIDALGVAAVKLRRIAAGVPAAGHAAPTG